MLAGRGARLHSDRQASGHHNTIATPGDDDDPPAQPPPCDLWVWGVEPFLRDEGFTEIVFPATKDVHLYSDYIHDVATDINAGLPDRAVAGLHLGCIEVFARPSIGTIADLRGKTVAVGHKSYTVTLADGRKVEAPDLFYGFWVSLLAHVGIPLSEINFVETGIQDTSGDFANGKADAVMLVAAGGPRLHASLPQDRYRVLVDTTMDKPWSQYYCCVLRADDTWARANPVAVKRATRAILRAVDQMAKDRPAAVKTALANGVNKTNPALTEPILQATIKDLAYDWREYDPAESVRFYALRLAEGKLVQKTPQQLIDQGLDVAWFRQLQKELKS